MAVVLTLVQTKQTRINKHKRNKKRSTNNTKHSKCKYTYYQNTHTYTHPHITKPTHTHITKPTHTHTYTLQNPHTHTHTHTVQNPHIHNPHITKQVKTTTVQVCLARISTFHTVGMFESGDTDFEIALWEIRSEV